LWSPLSWFTSVALLPLTSSHSLLLVSPFPQRSAFNFYLLPCPTLYYLASSLSTPVYRAAKMFSRGAFTAFILSLALVVFADVGPTIPDPGHIYNEGSTCQIGWTADPTGQWKTMNIQLMTGSNVQMVPLTSSSSCIFFLVQVMIDPCLLLSTSCRHGRWYHLPRYIQLPVSCGTCRCTCSL
jgi:hypothetical protein